MGSRKNDTIDTGVAVHVNAGLAHHRAGRLDEAAHQYEAALGIRPEDTDALHYLGVVAHQKGDHARAVDLINRALKGSASTAQMYCNLAEAQRASGALPGAEKSARLALDLRADYPEAHLNLAAALHGQKRFGEAEAAARAALALRAGLPGAMRLLADALREQHRIKEAEAIYRQVLASTPEDKHALTNLGWMLVQAGRMEEGLDLCERAARLDPANASLQENLGRALLEYGRIDEAMAAFERALQHDPDSAQLNQMIGAAWQEMGDVAESRKWVERSVELDPALVGARIQLSTLELERDNADEAIRILDAVHEDGSPRVDVLLARARTRVLLGDVEGAVADHRAAIALRPEAAVPHAALGGTLANAGDIDGAVAEMRKAIECNPRCVPAYAGLLAALKHRAKDSEKDATIELLEVPWMTDERRASLLFGLAAYYDGKAQYELAADHMVRANALAKAAAARRYRGYEAKQYEALVDRIIATFTPELFERLRPFGSTSERPVFIVGMPRSGTTLTEQIIASHPATFGAGERRFAQRGMAHLPGLIGRPELDALACVGLADGPVLERAARWHLAQLEAVDGGKALRIADKMPDNYSLLGWLAVLFPRARFIHTRRDFRDIALSCWITNFGEIRWANDLDDIAHRIEQHRRLMDHWRRVLPVPLFELDYEAMVGDQEGQSRQLIRWVGLEWDDRCLSFHKTERLVRTASVAQVREPIYNRSLARWTHYEGMLTPLIRRIYPEAAP